MPDTTALLIVYSRCNDAKRSAEWSDWYDEVQLPDSVGPGRADVATRFELLEQPTPLMPSIGFSHLSLYEFSGADADARLDALLADDASLRRKGRVHPNHCVIGVDILKAHGRETKPPPHAELQGHILAYVLCNQPEREAEWDAWYDEVHLPDMLDSGAFSAGTRWRRRVPLAYGSNDLTLYDVSRCSLDEAVERSAAVMPGIAAAGRKHPCHAGGMVVKAKASGRHAGAGYRA